MKDLAKPGLPAETTIRERVRRYIVDDLMLGTADQLDDAASLSRSGILDSTGALELVSFLEEEFAIAIADRDLVPANLDTVNGIVAMVGRKLAGLAREVA